jgi:hypothetical protein
MADAGAAALMFEDEESFLKPIVRLESRMEQNKIVALIAQKAKPFLVIELTHPGDTLYPVTSVNSVSASGAASGDHKALADMAMREAYDPAEALPAIVFDRLAKKVAYVRVRLPWIAK